jgi:hypothetical protein
MSVLEVGRASYVRAAQITRGLLSREPASMAQSQRWCLDCEDYTLHARSTLFSGIGCLLVMVSCLLLSVTLCGGILFMVVVPTFIMGWLLIAILAQLLIPWRCQTCGRPGNPASEPGPRKPLVFSKILLGSLARVSPAVRRLPAAMGWIISWIRRSPIVIDRNIRMAWSFVEAAYLETPDWVQPIVWGFGLSMPVAIVAIGIWTMVYI